MAEEPPAPSDGDYVLLPVPRLLYQEMVRHLAAMMTPPKRRSRARQGDLSDEQIREILTLTAQGLPQYEIGRRLGISHGSVQYWLRYNRAQRVLDQAEKETS